MAQDLSDLLRRRWRPGRLTLPLYLGVLDRTNVGTSEGRAPEWHRLGVGWATRPLVCERMVLASAGCTPRQRAHASASPSPLGIRVVRARKGFPSMYAEIAANLGAPRSAVRGELNAMNEQTLAKTVSPGALGTMNEFAHLAVNYRWMQDHVDLLDLALGSPRYPVQPSLLPGGHPRR